ncbi:MAG: DNA polymerase III subunit gamma/tau, partial [Candidatus Pacebacteria bacterium]|nr:DNA polymerase III subunit gamma/tau [Candidatus Paceibacterota bacterium]
MANLVLYRKYRPQSFKDFVGQEHVVKTLANEIAMGNISHAYLFSGPRGTGKTTLARLFAKAVCCQNLKGYEPCNECPACLEINKGKTVDLIEIDTASNRGIDDVKELREGIKFSPGFLKYKVLILDESHQLSKDAANALLKMLEEPPAHAIFILATTELHKMIPTILSRCQRFDFHKIPGPQIIEKLAWICEQEKVKIENEALALIAANAEGALRDAESILDQVISFLPDIKITAKDVENILGLVDINIAIKFNDLLIKKDAKQAISFLNENLEKGLDPAEFAKTFINYLRKILILQVSPDLDGYAVAELEQTVQNLVKQQARDFKPEELRKALKLFLEA